MPIYEFSCKDCRTTFSFFSRRVRTDAHPVCPKCGRPLFEEVSLFKPGRSKATDADPLGLGDDGLDSEFPDIPDFNPDDPRMAAAIAEMGDKIDKIDPSDTANAAGIMQEFAGKAGLKLNKNVMDAIGAMAAGDDSAATQNRLAEAVENGKLFEELRSAVKAAQSSSHYFKDPTLYDLQ